MNGLDSSGVHGSEEMIEYCNERKIQFYFVGVKGPIRDVFHKAGVVKKIGADQDGGLSFSTSSDIYALSIICFELLMGLHPCDVGVQPITDKNDKMEKNITYLSYHFLKKTNFVTIVQSFFYNFTV